MVTKQKIQDGCRWQLDADGCWKQQVNIILYVKTMI